LIDIIIAYSVILFVYHSKPLSPEQWQNVHIIRNGLPNFDNLLFSILLYFLLSRLIFIPKSTRAVLAISTLLVNVLFFFFFALGPWCV